MDLLALPCGPLGVPGPQFEKLFFTALFFRFTMVFEKEPIILEGFVWLFFHLGLRFGETNFSPVQWHVLDLIKNAWLVIHLKPEKVS